VAIGQKTVVSGREVQTLGGLVQDHEVVACALHFCEANSHALIIRYAKFSIRVVMPIVRSQLAMQSLQHSSNKNLLGEVGLTDR
jgi:hypothetical protein